MRQPRALVAWSTGKDCAWALHELRRSGAVKIAGLLTTVTETFGRVSMHATREALLDRQAAALGLPCRKVRIPYPCPNASYEQEMARALAAARAEGITHVAFGDLFLEDVRAYREAKLAGTGVAPLFPLWGRPTGALVREMIEGGLRALITCVDPRRLDRAFAGRTIDAALLAELPPDVDPCGENGEFHSFAFAGPMFSAPIAIATGAVVERDGFVFADVLPAPEVRELSS